MSELKTELRLLRWPLALLGAALLLALAVGLGCWHLVQKANGEANNAVLESLRMQTDARRLQSEEQDIRIKISAYQGIVARGIVGPERRLDWVELIRDIQQEHQLLGLDYEILPQVVLPQPNTGYAFMNSTMRVQIPLLHEGDLLRFVNALQSRAPAFVRVRSCRIIRGTTQAASETSLPAQLQADCQLDWITLQGQSEQNREQKK